MRSRGPQDPRPAAPTAAGGADADTPPSARGPLVSRLLGWADRPAGVGVLAVLALLEATVFPGPTEAMLVALTLARRRRAWLFAAVATAASAVGGVVGYQLGAAYFETVTRPLLASYDLLGHLDTVARVYRDNALLALATSGYTPVPYMLYTSVAGATDQPLLPFVGGSVVGRALKYVPIVALAYAFGPAVHRMLGRLGWAAGVLVAVALAVALLLRR